MTGEKTGHECAKQEEFIKLLTATTKMQGQSEEQAKSLTRLESAMERMAESVTTMSESIIKMQATQVTSDAFNKKFEEFEKRFREEKEEAIKASEKRDETLHQRINGISKMVDRHDIYFAFLGIIILLLLNNAFNIIGALKAVF